MWRRQEVHRDFFLDWGCCWLCYHWPRRCGLFVGNGNGAKYAYEIGTDRSTRA